MFKKNPNYIFCGENNNKSDVTTLSSKCSLKSLLKTSG